MYISFISVAIETFTNKDSEWYNLTRGKRLAIIFNHEFFKNGMSQRKGTQEDCEAIKNTFQKLSFEVQLHNDLKVTFQFS